MSIYESDSRNLSHNGMYKSFFENHPDGIYILDMNGNFLDANPTTLNVLGYKRDEFIGLNYRELIVPEYMDRAKLCFLEAAKGVPQSYQMVINHKSGKTLEVFVTNTPIEVDSTVVGVFGIARDLTEHNTMSEELLQAKTQLELFVENNTDAIAFFTSDGLTVKINQAVQDMFGWTSEELVGLHLTELPMIPPELTPEALKMMKVAADGQSVVKGETVRLTRNGQPLHILLAVTPIPAIGQFAVTMKDVTELATAQALLHQTEKLSAVGKLAAAVAHEIRNPLTALKGFTQLLHKKSRGENRRYFEIMQSELNRIDSILGELLVLAKPQALSFQPRDVEMILQEVISLMNTEAVMKQVTIDTEFINSAVVPMVNCEGNQLKQVFINIVKNGIEAMPFGGRLFVSSKLEPDYVSIEFKDEGEGIPEDQIPRLGEPFYTTKAKGTGLGVMVSQKILSAHHGELAFESKVGHGTTVRVRLPLVGDAETVDC